MRSLLHFIYSIVMRRNLFVLLLPAALLAAEGCFAPPTLNVPSSPRTEVRIGSISFTITGASLNRDFAPRVLDPGPDGGGTLGGLVNIRVHNAGQDDHRFNAAAVVYDERDGNHPVTAVPRIAGQPLVWDGTIAPGGTVDLEVAIGNGPYVEIGARVSVVLMFVRHDGDTGTLRTPPIEVGALRS
ncbi:MAG TPA: hypothetical protein PKK95_03775 [Vicinamibacterales bacterium]|nr:hypothetical protein [Acidobacteriota bacterium]HOC17360.1 hypothetical protein [Vicinamibacterales bacterium]